MNTTWQNIGRNTKIVLQIAATIACVVFIYLIFPKVNRFKYSYEKGKPWQYEDLISPFSFSLLKSQEALDAEQQTIMDQHEDHYSYKEEVEGVVLTKFYDLLDARLNQLNDAESDGLIANDLLTKGQSVLDSLYEVGVLSLHQEGSTEIVLFKDGIANRSKVKALIELNDAKDFLVDYNFGDAASSKLLRPIIIAVLEANILFDAKIDQEILDNKLSKVVSTEGLIQKGEKVVENGDIVDAASFQKLESLELAYSEKVAGIGQIRRLATGYVMAISIALAVLMLYLFHFRKEVFYKFRHYMFLLFLIAGMLLLTSIVLKNNIFFLYAIPFCIVPIVLRAFFGRELALYVHLVIILIAALFVPKSFQFIFIQMVAGIIAIYGNKNVRYWSQFFKAIGFIWLAYLFSFIAMYLIADSDIKSIDAMLVGALTINAFLTFLAYPLIPFFEKLFGFLSEISLVEYTDLNKPLLKRLSLEAPGTFQHSLQVANLAEAATEAIGGNSLIAKVGGLYHDIGKLEQPHYFIENQGPNNNPHSRIDYDESAEIIIAHVTDGVKLAKKENLPNPIIDFIKTHHGTSRVEYFYRLHTQENIPENVDENKFIYPGPKPSTKEQAVLMMADSVEAAAKSLKDPNTESIAKLVDGIVQHQMTRGQFDNAPISFQEISTSKAVFKKMLASIHHIRIAYPSEK